MYFDDEEDDTDNPPAWRRIAWGLGGAAFATYLAHECFTSGEGKYILGNYLRSPSFILHGRGAFVLGLDFTFVALYLHFHYFWASFPTLEPIRWLITRISLLGVVATTIFLLLYVATHPNTRKAPNTALQRAGLRLSLSFGSLGPSRVHRRISAPHYEMHPDSRAPSHDDFVRR